jgi:hypothetical protein
MINRAFNFFSSLRLTVVLLGLALLLVFIGTLAQVKLGLYVAQSEYFRSLFVFWKPKGASWKIPVFPGGWLLGGMLLINLIAAHVKRFQFTKKKIGIFTIHAGLILLLLGQFCTELFQIESNIRFAEGETWTYSEDSRHNELAIVDVSNPDRDEVVSIPEALLAKGGEIRHPKLPFVIRIKNFFQNSEPAGPMSGGGNKIKATDGVGKRLQFSQQPIVATMDDENKPTALLEIASDKGPIGEWTVSLWLTKFPWNFSLHREMGTVLGSALDEPQSFQFDGRTYQISLRPIRYYKPYSISLLEFRHDRYQGTDIPKNFSSKVHLSDPKRGEDRDVLIKMNDPLRYAGETFFQAGFDKFNDKVTVLQVVKNPAAITPYLACALVGIGLLTQFLMHLVNFGRRSKNKPVTTSKNISRKTAVAATASGERRTS